MIPAVLFCTAPLALAVLTAAGALGVLIVLSLIVGDRNARWKK